MMTARQFFAAHQLDGRAVLAGAFDDPRIWIAEVDGHLLLCHRREETIQFLADDTVIAPHRAVYSRRQFPVCRCWFCDRYDARHAA